MKNACSRYECRAMVFVKQLFVTVVLNCFCLPFSFAQLTGTKNIPGDYASLALAIADLNTQGAGSGGVTLNLVAGNPQTAPAGGYSITTTTGSAANQIILQGNGNTISAFSPQSTGSINDALFKLIGADWVTITGFTLQENVSNTTSAPVSSNNMTEFGIALFYGSGTNGAQNNTILNNTISLNRTYSNTFGIYSNTRHTATSMTAIADITNASGSNSGNKIYGNAISNVNTGIALIGSGNASFMDSGNDIGGTSPATGNTITNWGGAAAASSYVSISTTSSNCIFMNHQTTASVSFNTLTSAAVVPTVAFRGIVHDYTASNPSGTFTCNIKNNTITMTSGQTSGTFRCIDAAGGNTTMTLNISNNSIISCAISGTSSSASLVGIANSGSINTFTANGNIFNNNTTTATSGSFTAIQNTGNVTTAINMNNNQVGNSSGGAITYSAASSVQSTYLLNSGGTSATALSISGNNFQGITYMVSSAIANTFISNTSNTLSQNLSNNTFTNLSMNISGILIFINNSISLPVNGVLDVNANSIATAFVKSAAGGDVYFYFNQGSGNSTSTENNTNNNFSNITVSGGSNIQGWWSMSSGPNKTISGNTFSNLSAGTGSVTVIRASNSGTGNSISNNTISNVSSGGVITGILAGGADCTVSLNSISSLASASQSATGINSSGTNITISRNVLSGFSGASTSEGITSSSTTVSILKNKICDLTASSASGLSQGIIITSGTSVAISNNMIGDLRAPNHNGNSGAIGIRVNSISTLSINYNTVYLNATSSSANFGSVACFISTSTTFTLMNNILVNLSTPLGSGRTVALQTSTVPFPGYQPASNNNLLYAGVPSASRIIYYGLGSLAYSTLAQFKSAVAPCESGSVTELPSFISTSCASPDFLHIQTAISTLVESRAVNIAGITDDFDNQVRQGNGGYAGSSSIHPDIGADEGDFITSPVISYAALGLTCSFGDRNLTGVQVSDDSGIPLSGPFVPRIYYRKNAGSYFSQPGTFVSGTSTNSIWNFTIIAADMGGLTGGDTVSYYVAAQDNDGTPHTGSEPPGIVATNVNAVTTHPDVNKYACRFSLSGSYTIGTGGSYTNLTTLAYALNYTSALAGDCIFELTPSYSAAGETYPVTFNQDLSCDGNNYTIILRPQAGVISVVNNSPLFVTCILSLNGMDRMTIDGRPGGTGTAGVWTMRTIGSNVAVIQHINDASNNTVQYMKLEAAGNSRGLVYYFSQTGTTGNDNNAVLNCIMRDRSDVVPPSGAYPNAGVMSEGSGTLMNDNITVSGNQIFNFSNYAIYAFSGVGNSWVVTNNHIYSLVTSTALSAIIPINFVQGSGTGHLVSDNYIGGQAPFHGGSPWSIINGITFTGITFNAGTAGSSTISNNKIDNIVMTEPTLSTFYGMNLGTGQLNVTGNRIGSFQTANSISIAGNRGSYGISSSTSLPGGYVNMQYDTICNITQTSTGSATQFSGFWHNQSGQITMANCLIKNITSSSTLNADIETNYAGLTCAIVGINMAGDNTSNACTNNTITGLHAITTNAVGAGVCGISFDHAGGGNVSGNKIYDLTNTATGTSPLPGILGIRTRNFFGAMTRTFFNNMIALSNGSNTNGVKIYGFADEGDASRTTNYYFNSVVVSGSSVSAVNSAAFIRLGTLNPSVNLKNNIFYNRRSGSGKHYSLINLSGSATGWSASASNYSNLYSSNPATLGAWPLATDRTFAGWKTTSGGDANSKNAIVSFFDVFTDLHLNTYTNGALNNTGIPAGGITVDFDNQTGNRATTPDMGADENTYVPPSCNTSFTKPYCPGTATGTATISIGNGGPPYTYSWSNGQTTATATGLLPASYTVTVTDTTLFTICTSVVIVPDSIDVTPPVITCPATASIPCAADTIPATTGIPLAADDCSPPVVFSHADVISGQTCQNNFTITRTWYATDAAGNTSSCVQTINVNDNIAPVITACPADIVLNCGDPLPSAAGLPFTDNCIPVSGTTPAATVMDNNASCINSRIITYTWTATDACGNSTLCTQTISYHPDVTAPVFTNCPANVVLNCGDALPPVASPAATDACSGAATVVYNGQTDNAPQVCPTNLVYTRTWTATDACGNSTLCTQTISFNPDVVAPVFSNCPANVALNCGDALPLVASPSATDACSGAATVVYNGQTDNAPQACPTNLVYTRSWTATDACGNSTLCTQTISFNPDVVAPVFSNCPANVVLNCGDALPPVASPAANDACSGAATVVYNGQTDNAPQVCPTNLVYTRTWTATDACGNSTLCTQTISFNPDVIAPIFSNCPANVVLNCGDALPPVASPAATDACSGAATVVYNGQTDNAPQACPTNLVYTRSWTATDACGNSTLCSQTISYHPDVTPPSITCPSTLVVSANTAGCSATGVALGSPTTNDDCGSVTISNNAPVLFPPGNTTVTWTATDACGNASTCIQTVTVINTLTASCSGSNVTCFTGNNGSAAVTPAGGAGSYTYLWNNGAVTSSINGLTAGTYCVTVTDINGCTATCSYTVTQPVALVASSSQGAAIQCFGGSTTVTVSASGGTPPYSGDGVFTVNAGTYTYTVSDANGCTASTLITISEPSELIPTSSNTPILCTGGTSTVTVTASGGVPPYTGTGNFTVTAGPHSFSVTDANGCVAVTFILVTEPPLLSASCSGTNLSCHGGNDGTASVAASGGTGSYAYLWNNGAVSSSLSGLTAGTWCVTVTDANGCTATCCYTVSAPTVLIASSTATVILCNGGTSTVSVSATGGTPPYTGTGSFTAVAGTHSYTVTDANGCTVTTTITISQPSALTAASTATPILCNGGNATVNVSASGGTMPYTGTGSFTVPAGTHSYMVTDANGCSSSTSITLTEPAIVSATCSGTHVSCNGGHDGTVSVSSSGGTGPHTYLWSNGSITSSVSGLAAGVYCVVVTDVNGCTASCCITLSEPTALQATSSAGTISCHGGTTAVTVLASGGTPPYTGTGNFSVVAGTYTYTVTDANGCIATTTIAVSEPTSLTAASTATAIACFGGNSTVSVSAGGGTPPYTGTGNYTVSAGTYSYTVTDANGCIISTSITVNEPSPMTVSCSGTSVTCGGANNGTASVASSGGTGAHTYQWSNGSVNSAITGLPAGIYCVTVTDANSCTTSCCYTVTASASLIATATASSIACHGGASTVTVSAGGGIPPYSGTGTFSVSAGTYSYTVTDAVGCTASATITVTEPTVLMASSTATPILCYGGNSTVTVTASGGTPPYTGTGNFTVSAGFATYTVTDANGCTAAASITVTEPPAMVATCSGTSVSCYGGNNGSASVSSTGGTGPHTYLWSNGSVNATLTGLTAGTWCVTVTDANNCSTTCCYTVTQPAQLSATAVATTILCHGGTATVTISAAGGTPPYQGTGNFTVTAGTYSYTVSDDNGCTTQATVIVNEPAALSASSTATAILCNGGTATVTVSASGGTPPYTGTGTFMVSAGSYSYSVSDANGCVISTSVSVSEPPLLTAAASATSILCNGGNAAVTVTASGGTSPYTGEGTFIVTAGTYTYTVTDANGCTASVSISVTQPSPLVGTAVATPILCNGGTSTVTVSATGGIPPYTGTGTFTLPAGTHTFIIYSYMNANDPVATICQTSVTITITEPDPVSLTASSTPILCFGGNSNVTISATGGIPPYTGTGVFSAIAGNYTYTVTDANLCSSTISVTVTQPAPLSASSSASAISCNGSTANVTVVASGGTPPYSGTGVFAVPAGNYNFTVSDANGCTTTTTITVNEPGALTVSSTASAITCYGGSATVSVTASGGIPPYSGTGSYNVGAGTYSYTVSDANGCTAVTTITVSEPSPLSAACSGSNITCSGVNNGTVSVFSTGGTGAHTYQWSNGPVSSSQTGLAAGTYCVTVTDANGCSVICCYTVNGPPLLIASATNTAILCYGGMATVSVSAIGGTAPYTGTGNFSVPAGTYSYTVTDANGCTSSTTIPVTEPTVLTASASATAILCHGGNSTVTISGSGGTPPYTGTGTFAVTASTYAYTITDANGCASQATVTVNEPPALTLSCSGTNVSCNGGNDGTASVSVSGGTGPYTYQWSNGPVSASISGLNAGTYCVIVTDANGCTATCCYTVTVPSTLNASSTASAVLCYGGTATVTVSATGGTPPYAGTGNFTVTAGTHSYTVTDAGGCTAITTISVNQPTALTASSSSTAILCNGGNATVSVSASGGTPPYTGTGNFTAGAGTHAYSVTDYNGCPVTTTIVISQPSAVTATSTAAAIVCHGGSATVTVTAAGGTPPYTGTGSYPVPAGTYSYTVTDANGCTGVTSITVTQPATLSASATATAVTCPLCTDGTVSISSITGGTPPYSYTNLSGLGTGVYCILVTDANGCTTQACATVGAGSCVLTATAAVTTPVACFGGTAIAAVYQAGGTPPLQYKEGAGSYQSGNVFAGLTAGIHTFTVKDANNCLASVTLMISQPAILSCSISHTDATYWHAANGTATVTGTGGTGPYTYSWNTTPVQTTATATGLKARTTPVIGYTVVLTDANGCTTTCQVTISEPGYLCVYPGLYTSPTAGQWGSPPAGFNLSNLILHPLFSFVFPNGATIGGYGRTLKFNCAKTITNWLPANGGSARRLDNANYINPRKNSNPTFPNPGCGVNGPIYTNPLASQTLTLLLTVEYDKAFSWFSPIQSIAFEDLIYTQAPFGGWSVKQVLAEANRLLGQGIIGGQTNAYYNTVTNALTNIIDRTNLTCPVNYAIRLDNPEDAGREAIENTKLYPNPNDGIFTLQFESGGEEHLYLHLTDVTGRLLETTEYNSTEGMNTIRFNKADLPKGVYFMNIIWKDKRKTIKVILQ